MKALLFVVILAAGFAVEAAAQSAEDLFQQALRVERVSGNTEAAIDLYAQVVMDYPMERGVVARALLQMGKAFEVLGRDGARQAYSRILSEYADFETVASEAAERIAAFRKLDTPIRTEAPLPGSVEVVVLDVEPPGLYDLPGSAGISPDGKYVARQGSGTSRGTVVLQHLESGTIDSLVVIQELCGSSYSARFSPNGNQIAVGCLGDQSDSGWGVAVFDRDSRTAELIFDERDYFGDGHCWTHVLDWSTDGSGVLASFQYCGDPDFLRSDEILLLPVSGESHTVIESDLNTTEWWQRACFLGDGRFMFGSYGWESMAVHRTDTRNGERAKVLSDDQDGVQVVDCLPDSNTLIYSGASGLFAATVGSEGAVGAPRFLTSLPERALPVPGAKNGSVYYGESQPEQFIATADVDTVRGRAVSNLRKVDALNQHVPALRWSPDGNRFVVNSRGTATIAGINGFEDTVLELPRFAEGEGNTEIWKWFGLLIWSPDGSQLLSSLPADAGGQWHYKGTEVYDRDTGELRDQVADLAAIAWLPDASGFYYVAHAEARRCLRTFHFESRATEEVFCLEGKPSSEVSETWWKWWSSPGWSLSPDGSTFAYWGREGGREAEERPIYLLDTETWKMEQIGVIEVVARSPQISWSSDSSRLFSWTRSEPSMYDAATGNDLRSYNLVKGEWSDWSLSGVGDLRIQSVAVHPSGAKVAIHGSTAPLTGIYLSILHQPPGLPGDK